jgi:16S rRNA processing protein RimM
VAARICVGRIGAAHGTRGEVKLWSFTADPMAVADYGALESEDGTRSFKIEALRPAKDFLVARFAGVADRTAAEQLCNLELYVARHRLPAPAADEYYHADLIGLAVEDASGATLGTVVAVHNFGAGDIIEVQPALGGMTVMLPFTAAVVPVVDVAGGRIVVEPLAGTFSDDRASGED